MAWAVQVPETDLISVTINQLVPIYVHNTYIECLIQQSFTIFESVSGCRRVFEHLKQISIR